MARVLVATVPLAGHVNPMVLVVRALVARGHEVRWCAGSAFRGAVESSGAAFVALAGAPVMEVAGVRGLAKVKRQLIELFIAPAPVQAAQLAAECASWSPALLLADSAHLGAALEAERSGVPFVQLGVSALMLPGPDVPPFGAAMHPTPGPKGRQRHQILHWVVWRMMFWSVNRALRAARRACGLPASRELYCEVVSRDLYLQPTAQAFEYPRESFPPQLRFIGPLVASSDAALPAWWEEAVAARAAGVPVVLLTQGTMAVEPRELLEPALAGLASSPVFVMVASSALVFPLPANARAAAFIPYAAAMQLASVVVTNGGYGGVQMALHAGVPLVVAGGSEEKPELAARVSWAGAGVDLKTGTPSPQQVRDAVARVLSSPSYAMRAGELSSALRRHDAPAEAVSHIEELLASRHASQAALAPAVPVAGVPVAADGGV